MRPIWLFNPIAMQPKAVLHKLLIISAVPCWLPGWVVWLKSLKTENRLCYGPMLRPLPPPFVIFIRMHVNQNMSDAVVAGRKSV